MFIYILSYSIPIEISHGDKDTTQIKDAIRRYKAPHGIIISGTTKTIKKVDNIIFYLLKHSHYYKSYIYNNLSNKLNNNEFS